MRVLPLLLLTSGAALGAGLLERNHPLVDEGAKAFEAGRYEEALGRFDEAAKALPPKASLEFNRGSALHKLGRNDEARAAFLRAAELDKTGEYANTIHYNLGNVWAAQGDKKAAVAEYRKALRADPSDGQARHNLEVLLRDLPPPQKPQTGPDGGVDDGGNSDGGSQDSGAADGGSRDGGRPTDGGRGDAGAGDGGPGDAGADAGADGGADGGSAGDGGRGDGGSGDGGRGDGGSPQDGGSPGQQPGSSDAGSSSTPQRSDAGSADGGAGQDGGMDEEVAKLRLSDGGMGLSKGEAESLLDAMKNGEKQLQLWRFQQKRPKKPNAKDW